MADEQPPQNPEPPKPGILKGKEALALCRDGKDAWNGWAEAHEGWKVDFTGITFQANAVGDFGNEYIDFKDFVFPGTALFGGATFEKNAVFDHSIFKNTADFSTTEFKGPFSLIGAQFSHVPDFRHAKFGTYLSLHGINVKYKNKVWGVGIAAEKDDVVKYRRLKELAKKAEDHEAEQLFFAHELKAKRFWHTRNPVKLLFSYLYQITSNFGRSVLFPTSWLGVSWLLFAGYYLQQSNKPADNYSEALKAFDIHALQFSANQLVPFLAAAKGIGESAKTALFSSDYTGWLSFFMMLEGVIGLAFIFLIGLGLRNMFRI